MTPPRRSLALAIPKNGRNCSGDFQGASLSANPRAHERTRSDPSGAQPPDNRPPRAGIRPDDQGNSGRAAKFNADLREGGYLSLLRDRGVGSGAGQHPFARRQNPDVRNRPFRHPLEECGLETEPPGRFPSRGLAAAARTRRRSKRNWPRIGESS